MSAERYSLDTNILIYSVDRQAGERHTRAIEWIKEMARCDCILTLQSLTEFYSAVVRKNKMPRKDARAQVEDWMILFPVIAASPLTIKRAMEAVEHHGLSFWDAMLLEAAAQAGVTRLLSEDMQHGRIWRGMSIQNPFL